MRKKMKKKTEIFCSLEVVACLLFVGIISICWYAEFYLKIFDQTALNLFIWFLNIILILFFQSFLITTMWRCFQGKKKVKENNE